MLWRHLFLTLYCFTTTLKGARWRLGIEMRFYLSFLLDDFCQLAIQKKEDGRSGTPDYSGVVTLMYVRKSALRLDILGNLL